MSAETYPIGVRSGQRAGIAGASSDPAEGRGGAGGPGYRGAAAGPQAQPGQQPGWSAQPAQQPPAPGRGWTAGRITAVVIGSIIVLVSAALLAGGATLLWAGLTQRQDGYLTSSQTTYSTNGYALASETIHLHSLGWDWANPLIGTTRLRVTETGTVRPVFVGIAPAAAADGYLSGVQYSTVTGLGGGTVMSANHPGTAPRSAPGAARIWAAQVSGAGRQILTWTARSGDWRIVVMNRNAAAGLTVRADAGVTVPALWWITGGLLAAGVLLAVGGVLLIMLPVRRAHRERARASYR